MPTSGGGGRLVNYCTSDKCGGGVLFDDCTSDTCGGGGRGSVDEEARDTCEGEGGGGREWSMADTVNWEEEQEEKEAWVDRRMLHLVMHVVGNEMMVIFFLNDELMENHEGARHQEPHHQNMA